MRYQLASCTEKISETTDIRILIGRFILGSPLLTGYLLYGFPISSVASMPPLGGLVVDERLADQ
jgi:hypothetical protein